MISYEENLKSAEGRKAEIERKDHDRVTFLMSILMAGSTGERVY